MTTFSKNIYKLPSIFLGLILSFFLTFTSSAEEDNAENKTLRIEKVYRLDVNSSINPATYNYLSEGLKKAKKNNIDLMLITMNTPGGLVTTTKDILNLFGESDIPIAMWVRPEGASATSAGAILASGSHLLFMSEGTNMGAATPVQMGGDIEQEDARNKAVNDLVALVKSLSDARGRSSEGFEEMISEAKSFTATQALEQNLINGIANSERDIWEQIHEMEINIKGNKTKLLVESTPEVEVVSMDPGQALLNFFANPITAYILFLLGAALLYFEMQSPGGFIAGGLGVLFLILAGIGFQVLPLNVGALVLIALAFVLFLLEVYITSYGIFSIAGVISLITGSLFLYRTEDSYIELSTPVIFSSVAAIIVFILVVLAVIARDQKNVGKEKFNHLIGRKGHIIGELPKLDNETYFYQVKIAGELWKAKSTDNFNENEPCEVVHHDDHEMILTIKKIS